MQSDARDIAQCAFSALDGVVIDTNVWLLIYGPPAVSTDRRIAAYSSGFKRLLESGCAIYLNMTLLSECCAGYARMVHRLFYKQHQDWKAYRRSADYAPVAQEIAAFARRVVAHCTWLPGDYKLADVDPLLDEYAKGSADMNDLLLANLCRANGWLIMTDDADFAGLGVSIVTANTNMTA